MIGLDHQSPSGDEAALFRLAGLEISTRRELGEDEVGDRLARDGERVQLLADALRHIALGARDPESIAMAALHAVIKPGESITDVLSPTWES